VTDIHTTWTESRAVLGRGEQAVQQALDRIAETLPFALRGVDSDNGSEFIQSPSVIANKGRKRFKSLGFSH
jgi:hypothetical protein